jgi:hypothetical protein
MRSARLDHMPKTVAPDLVNLQNELAFRKRWLKDWCIDPASDRVAEDLREQIGRLRAAG